MQQVGSAFEVVAEVSVVVTVFPIETNANEANTTTLSKAIFENMVHLII